MNRDKNKDIFDVNKGSNMTHISTESGSLVEINSFHYFIFKLVATQRTNFNLTIFASLLSAYVFLTLLVLSLIFSDAHSAYIFFLIILLISLVITGWQFFRKHLFLKQVKIYSQSSSNKTEDNISQADAPAFVRSTYTFLRRKNQLNHLILGIFELFLFIFLIVINATSYEADSFTQIAKNYQWILWIQLLAVVVLHCYTFYCVRNTKQIVEMFWSTINQVPGWKTTIFKKMKKR